MTSNRSIASVIPKLAWAIAIIVFFCGYFVMKYLAIPSDPQSVHWPQGGKLLLSILAPLVAPRGSS